MRRQVTYDSDGGCYELLIFSAVDGIGGSGEDPQEVRRGGCLAAVFLARNRFAVLDKNRQVGGSPDCAMGVVVPVDRVDDSRSGNEPPGEASVESRASQHERIACVLAVVVVAALDLL